MIKEIDKLLSVSEGLLRQSAPFFARNVPEKGARLGALHLRVKGYYADPEEPEDLEQVVLRAYYTLRGTAYSSYDFTPPGRALGYSKLLEVEGRNPTFRERMRRYEALQPMMKQFAAVRYALRTFHAATGLGDIARAIAFGR